MPNGGFAPFGSPHKKRQYATPHTGRIPPFLVLKHGSPLYCGILFSILKANISNEFYARDTSRKIRSVFKSKGMSGKHLTGTVIYGYLWDEKREHWLVDEEAARVVRRIFSLTMGGLRPLSNFQAAVRGKG